MELLSGAGHDAQIIGEKVPTAMIFARASAVEVTVLKNSPITWFLQRQQ